MDAAKKKAVYRAKLAQKQEKRIESPLIRYNEHDQPICRVCEVVLKSESLWSAHQASRKHHEAINNIKANAAALYRANDVKSGSTELPKPKTEHSTELLNNKPEASTGILKPRSSSMLPPDFFDNRETKKQKADSDSHNKVRDSAKTPVTESFNHGNKRNGSSNANIVEVKSNETQPARQSTQISKIVVSSETKQVKGALPEGFFDDKDADLRARGITPVKPDIKDEYKEFQKAIEEDLQEVDNRLEEEEYDAAEMIEEAESVEQRTYRERVEMFKKKKIELKAARSAMHSKGPQSMHRDSTQEESSSDDGSDENFTVDWRAKHL